MIEKHIWMPLFDWMNSNKFSEDLTTYLITIVLKFQSVFFEDISFLMFVHSRLLSDINYCVYHWPFSSSWFVCFGTKTGLPGTVAPLKTCPACWIRSPNPVITAVRPLIKEKSGFYRPDKKTPQEKPILNYSPLDPFAVSSGMHPAEGRCLGFPSDSGNAMLFYGGIRARGSRRPIVSQCCSGSNLLVESARHRLQSQQTVRVESASFDCG